MAAALELLKFFSRKRKAEQEFLGHQYRLKEEMAKKRFRRKMEFETEASQPAVMSAIVITKSDRNERGPDELRNGNWWTDGYQNWDEESFKKRLRVSRDTFEFILTEIKDLIVKEPTRMKPHPTPPATQLALCLYRLAHGCTFLTVGDLFGVAESTAHIIFQDSLSIRRFWGKGEIWTRKMERGEGKKRLTQMLLLEPSTPTQHDSIPSNQNHFRSLGCQLHGQKARLKSQEKITDSHFWIFLGI